MPKRGGGTCLIDRIYAGGKGGKSVDQQSGYFSLCCFKRLVFECLVHLKYTWRPTSDHSHAILPRGFHHPCPALGRGTRVRRFIWATVSSAYNNLKWLHYSALQTKKKMYLHGTRQWPFFSVVTISLSFASFPVNWTRHETALSIEAARVFEKIFPEKIAADGRLSSRSK